MDKTKQSDWVIQRITPRELSAEELHIAYGGFWLVETISYEDFKRRFQRDDNICTHQNKS